MPAAFLRRAIAETTRLHSVELDASSEIVVTASECRP